jgi:hypothetical protein
MRLDRVAGTSLVAALWAATVMPAERSAPPEPPVFRTGVRVVAVPVYVTDKAGHSVTGVGGADFSVDDEGHPVPIVAFEEVDGGVLQAPV